MANLADIFALYCFSAATGSVLVAFIITFFSRLGYLFRT